MIQVAKNGAAQERWVVNTSGLSHGAEQRAAIYFGITGSGSREQKVFIKQCYAKAAKAQPVGKPLNWLINPFSAEWKLNENMVRFNWS